MTAGARDHRNVRRALSFGAQAEQYDRVRPRYPEPVVAALAEEAVLVGAGAESSGHLDVLDIGTGTGILARPLVGLGHRVLGLEPDPQMADVARSRGGIEVVVGRFEDWDGRGPDGVDRRFDLLVAGQCWHWLDPDRAPRQAARLLRPGGQLALLWNHPVGFGPARPEIELAYARFALPLARDSVVNGAGPSTLTGFTSRLAGTGLFDGVRERTYDWQRTYSADDWVSLLATHSDHSQLPDDQREPLLDAIGAAIRAAGGQYEVSYRTFVITGRNGRLDA